MKIAAALPEARFTPAGVVRALGQYRWRCTAFFCVSIAAGLASILLIAPEYQSNALLMVRFGQQQVYRSPVGSDSALIAQGGSDGSVDMVNTQVQLLRSRDVIEPVIQQIGLARLYPDLVKEQPAGSQLAGPASHGITVGWQKAFQFYRDVMPTYMTTGDSAMERAVRRFESDLTVQQARASLLLQVSYRNRDPLLAREVLEKLIEMQRQVSATLDGNDQTKFYTVSIEQTRRSLLDAGDRLTQFRLQQGIIAYKEQLPILLQQRQGLQQDRERLDQALQGVEQRNLKLAKQLAALPANVTAFTDTQASLQLPGTTRNVRNPLVGEVESALAKGQAEGADLSGRIAQVAKQIDAVEGTIRRASELDAQRAIVENDVASLAGSLKALTSRAEEAKLINELSRQTSSSLSVAQKPTQPEPDVPVRPAPVRYMAVASVVGVLGALTLAMASAVFDARSRHEPAAAQAGAFMRRPSLEPGE